MSRDGRERAGDGAAGAGRRGRREHAQSEEAS